LLSDPHKLNPGSPAQATPTLAMRQQTEHEPLDKSPAPPTVFRRSGNAAIVPRFASLTRKASRLKSFQLFTGLFSPHDTPRTQQVFPQLPALQTRKAGPNSSGVWCGQSARERDVRGGSGRASTRSARGTVRRGCGKLLNDLLQSLDITERYLHCELIKCRPRTTRDPEPTKSKRAKPFLMQQIAMIRPKLVCTLGNWADANVAERKWDYKGPRPSLLLERLCPLPLLHPAAALHQGSMLDPLKEDFNESLREFLDRNTKSIRIHDSNTGYIPTHTPHRTAAPTQMDLFG